MGLFYRHTINYILNKGEIVQLYHINEFWWYNRRSRHTPSIQENSLSGESHRVSLYPDDLRAPAEVEVVTRSQRSSGSQGRIPTEEALINPILRLRNPSVRPCKGAPKRYRFSNTSTKRYRSAFELVEPPRKRKRGCNRRSKAPTPPMPL